MVPRPYSIVADTPEGMTAALRAIGLGGSWTRFSSFYEWIYDLEEIPHAFLDTPSGRCRFPSFQVDLRLTIEYPEWERPVNPDPLLAEAWDAFVELMERDFEERRNDVYTQLTELNHNAVPDTANDVDWPQAARSLDARALFTEPGAIYSYSGYDYPLAIWVLETVAGTDFPTLVASAVFRPLEMMSTSVGEPVRGVPVTSTTPADLMAFLAVWVDGGLRGAPPRTASATAVQGVADGVRWFDSGVWHDEVAGVTRVSLMCQSGGFQLFPETQTAFMLWTSGGWPNGVWRYLLSEVGEEQGAREEVLRPIGARGAASLGAVDPPCYEPWGLQEEVLSLGAPTPAADWAGLYRNGDQINELSDVDGFLKETNGQPLDVSHYRGDGHFVGLNGRAFYPLQLTRDTEGRRYLVLDGRAYIHQDDRPTR